MPRDGESFRQVAEDLRAAHRLVAVLRTRSVHQHDRWKRTAACRHSQRPRQLPLVGADGHGAFREAIRLAVRRPLPRHLAGQQEHAADQSGRVDDVPDVDVLLLEVRRDDHDGIGAGLLHGGIVDLAHRSEWLHQFGERRLGVGLLHLRREERLQFGIFSAKQQIQCLAGGRRGIAGRLRHGDRSRDAHQNTKTLHSFILQRAILHAMDGRIFVGCCGWREARARYFERFPVVELQDPFYEMPAPALAAKWRAAAPAGFQFCLKAWQLITHTPASPTYRRLKSKVSPSERDLYGSFRPTEQVRLAWERTREIARILDAAVVLFQCPASFEPTPANVRNFRSFFEHDRAGFVAPGVGAARSVAGSSHRGALRRVRSASLCRPVHGRIAIRRDGLLAPARPRRLQL